MAETPVQFQADNGMTINGTLRTQDGNPFTAAPPQQQQPMMMQPMMPMMPPVAGPHIDWLRAANGTFQGVAGLIRTYRLRKLEDDVDAKKQKAFDLQAKVRKDLLGVGGTVDVLGVLTDQADVDDAYYNLTTAQQALDRAQDQQPLYQALGGAVDVASAFGMGQAPAPVYNAQPGYGGGGYGGGYGGQTTGYVQAPGGGLLPVFAAAAVGGLVGGWAGNAFSQTTTTTTAAPALPPPR